MTDLIEVFPDMISPESCEGLIRTFESSELTERSAIFSADGTKAEHRIRQSSQLILTKESCGENYINAVQNAFQKAYMAYRDRYPILAMMDKVITEPFVLIRYKDNSESYKWHVDGSAVGVRYRILSAVCYLNTVEAGGETEFRLQDRKVKPVGGSILMFPSNWGYEHRGLPPEHGSKYIITNWLRHNDFPMI